MLPSAIRADGISNSGIEIGTLGAGNTIVGNTAVGYGYIMGGGVGITLLDDNGDSTVPTL